MSRVAFYLTCVAAFAFPISGMWMLLLSVFGDDGALQEGLIPYAIVALSLSMSVILAGLPSR